MDYLYFIIKGEVAVYSPVKKINRKEVYNRNIVKILNQKSDLIGVHQLITHGFTENVGYITRNVVTMVNIKIERFYETLDLFPEDRENFCLLKDRYMFNDNRVILDL